MTSGFDGYELPVPKDWQAFERLCRDLWAEIWDDPHTQLNGRGGQPQAGVDVFGRRSGGSSYSGLQCKRRGNAADDAEISEEELIAEIEKAKTFEPTLREFTLAFTGKRDAKIQAVARRIADEHALQGLFSVSVCSWDDIESYLGKYPAVFSKHFSGMVASILNVYSRLGPEHLLTRQLVYTQDTKRSLGIVFAQVVDETPMLEIEHQAEIQLVRKALKEGYPALALKQAEELRTRIWAGAQPGTRAKLLILLGHAKIESGNYEEGAKMLLEAAGHSPNDLAIPAQLALAHSLLGNVSAARLWAQKSLEQDPTNILAVQVATLYDERSDQAVLGSYEHLIGKRAELYSALGHRAISRKDFVAARAWFEKAVALDSSHPDILGAAGQALVDCVFSEPISRFHEGVGSREAMVRAANLLEKAILHLNDDSARKARADWYVCRTLAKRWCGASDVVESAEQALQICGKLDTIVRLRAAVALECEDYATAIELIEGLAPPRHPEDLGILAAAKGNQGDLERAAELWRELLSQSNLPSHQEHEARRNYILTLLLQKREDDAVRFVSSITEEAPRTLSSLLIAVTVAERLGKTAERNQLLDSALVVASKGANFLQLELGDALMRSERWSEAVEVYQQVVQLGSSDAYGQRLVQALFNSGRFESALMACDAAEKEAGTSEFLVGIRSSIYEHLGDLEQALRVCTDFLKVCPSGHEIAMRLATILLRKGDLEGSAAALEAVSVNSVLGSVHKASLYAQLLIQLKQSHQALDILYQMRRRHMQDVNAHLRYVSCYLMQELWINAPTKITTNVAVQLVGTGAPGWILITDDDDANIANKEYSRRHPLASTLLDKKVGDEVSVKSTTSLWTIHAIDSKYGFAFGQTLELFPSHFPTSGEIEQHNAPDDAAELVQQIRSRLQQGDSRREAVLSQYAAGRCTIGCVASVLRARLLEAMGIVSASGSGLVCSTNSVEEQQQALRLAEKADVTFLLDFTAVHSLNKLNMLCNGVLSQRKLAVAQTTIDELVQEEHHWHARASRPSMLLHIENGTLVKTEMSEQESARHSEEFKKLAYWLRTKAQVLPVPLEVAEKTAQWDKAVDLIGASSWDSVRIASRTGFVLVSDDLWLRNLGKSMLSVEGICSPFLLLSETNAGRLSNEQYGEAICKLVVSGYRILSINAFVLEAAARLEQWRPGPLFSQALMALRGPEAETSSAVRVAAEFVRIVWLSVLIAQHRSALLTAVMATLVAGRKQQDVIRKFKAHLSKLLRLHPIALGEISNIVDAFDHISLVKGTW